MQSIHYFTYGNKVHISHILHTWSTANDRQMPNIPINTTNWLEYLLVINFWGLEI